MNNKFKFIILCCLMITLTGCGTKKDYEQNLEQNLEQKIVEIKELKEQINQLKLEKEQLEIAHLKETPKEPLVENGFGYYIKYMLHNDNHIGYIIEPLEKNYQVINIMGEGKGNFYEGEDINTYEIKGNGAGEFVKIVVSGTIKDFELITVDCFSDEEEWKVKDGDINYIGDVTNTEIIIETTLPEGMPGEKIRWKDQEGNIKEIYLSYDGIGMSGVIIR